SWAPDASSIYQDGFRLPPVKIVDAGRFDEQVMAFVNANTRLPKNAEGDLHAQIAACRVGSERTGRLLAQYGWEAIAAIVAAIHDHGERFMRAEIKALPDGVYH